MTIVLFFFKSLTMIDNIVDYTFCQRFNYYRVAELLPFVPYFEVYISHFFFAYCILLFTGRYNFVHNFSLKYSTESTGYLKLCRLSTTVHVQSLFNIFNCPNFFTHVWLTSPTAFVKMETSIFINITDIIPIFKFTIYCNM